MKIAMTGGGTSGHVTPNIALFPELLKKGFDIIYIGTKKGVEYELIKNENIPFFEIQAGKLRRYLDIENVKDIAKICKGFFQAYKILKNEKPDVVFSKGGFVSCPVVWASAFLKIPVILHESDYTPGLANKLSVPFAKKICYAFPETINYLPKEKSILTGVPVRVELHEGNKDAAQRFCFFKENKPLLTVIGGSLGSVFLNEMVRANLDSLLKLFNVCHICGKNKIDTTINEEGYCQLEYVSEELKDIFAATDIFISRAGATAIFELLSINKPMLLVPLSKKVSRGDQILNAVSFFKNGYADYIEEDDLTKEVFLEKVLSLYKNKLSYIENQQSAEVLNSNEKVLNVIYSVIKE